MFASEGDYSYLAFPASCLWRVTLKVAGIEAGQEEDFPIPGTRESEVSLLLLRISLSLALYIYIYVVIYIYIYEVYSFMNSMNAILYKGINTRSKEDQCMIILHLADRPEVGGIRTT